MDISLIVDAPFYARNSDTRVVTSPAVSPQYNIDYGSMQPLIIFQSSSEQTTSNFQNDMINVSIQNVVVSNMTFYETNPKAALFGSFNEDIRSLTLKNTIMHDIEQPLSVIGLLLLKPKSGHFDSKYDCVQYQPKYFPEKHSSGELCKQRKCSAVNYTGRCSGGPHTL